MTVTPKLNIKYKLDGNQLITLNILDAKTRHLEQYVNGISKAETLKALRELRNSIRQANTEIERLEKVIKDISSKALY